MELATLNGRWESLAKNKPTMHMMLERQLAAVGDFQPRALLKSRFKLQDGQQRLTKKNSYQSVLKIQLCFFPPSYIHKVI
jgi:hypothetical protein